MGGKFDLAAIMEQRAAVPEAERTIETITAEILELKKKAGDAILGIGRRLNEAKTLLSHGEWQTWLEERVEFSERTAQRFMRLAREWSNPTALSDLGATKALVLLALPPEEREAFMGECHLVNGEEKTVIDMSTRELEKALREREEALAEKQAAQQAREQMALDMRLASERLEAAKQEREEAADREADLRAQLEELRSRPIEVVGAAVPDAGALEAARAEGAERARREAEERLQAELEQAKAEGSAAARKLKEAREAAKEREQSLARERDALKARSSELERKLRLADNQELAVFQVYYNALQEDFSRMLGCLSKLEGAGKAGDHDKLVNALSALLRALEEKVPGKVGEGDA